MKTSNSIQKIVICLIDVLIRTLSYFGNLILSVFGWLFLLRLGRIAGNFAYLVRGKKRRKIQVELSSLLGNTVTGKQLSQIAKETFTNHYQRMVETIFLGRVDQNSIFTLARSEGLEHLEQALAAGKGVILLLAHFGSFLLPLPFLGYQGYAVNQLAGKQIHSSLLMERIWLWRKKEADRLPIKFIQIDKFLRPLYQALQNNEIVALAFDGNDSSNWVTVQFAGMRVQFSTGPFDIARRTGATIIPMFAVRNKNYKHRFIFEPPFGISKNKALKKALYNDTQNFSNRLADFTMKYPSHFVMRLMDTR